MAQHDIIDRARQVIDCEIAGLQRVQQSLGQPFIDALIMMHGAVVDGHKLVISGVGKNLHIAEKLSATLASTGSTSVVLNPTQAMHGDLGMLQEGDILVALSYSGESDEILALLPPARRCGVKVVAMVGELASQLAQLADVAISVAIEREACPFNMAPTTSTTATLAVGDAMAMVLLDLCGFDRDDYAKLHPAGAIGRALLVRISDIMRTGERLPVVPASGSVKDGLVAMTRSRAGAAVIVDADGCLLGIFTDGDLRRHIAEDVGILETPITDVMTVNPITIGPSELAVQALTIFEEHRIDDLIVVDSQGKVVGAVDIQDLPKFKIL